MNTDDYILQCATHLSDTNTYRQADRYPEQDIVTQIDNIIGNFKPQIKGYKEQLYKYLLTNPKHTQIPQFYGIPKIHKTFTSLPPIRPIVSQTESPLTHTAQLIDHVLQPLAQTYPDYLHNSTSLVIKLQDLHLPQDCILVTIDVESLYPSIPQTECLKILYTEMHKHRQLMLFDPNLIIQLLQTNINYNYFQFADLTFQQIHGTAMGAAFSPTVANIYMSVILRNFLNTQQQQPLLLVRYIDDIFMIWPNNQHLGQFLHNLNNFHPKLHFTHEHSTSTINFLDLTIYKNNRKLTLDLKTYQKPHNLYQYLDFSSTHPRTVYKGIVTGECIRYLRTNTDEQNYLILTQTFKKRLIKRHYHPQFIDNCMKTIKYTQRHRYLRTSQPKPVSTKPIFKYLPPPHFKKLQTIILHNYDKVQQLVGKPLLISMGHRTLRQELVHAKVTPTDEQFVDIALILNHPKQNHAISGHLPQLKKTTVTVSICKHPRCMTCKHLNTSTTFKSTTTGIHYPIRHSFTCSSSNLIYLITCKRCKKQYIGFTTRTLKYRVNHHRTNILNKKSIYLCDHFNLPDHNIEHLSIQAIDTATETEHTTLRQLELYWIKKLQTLKPKGLNYTLDR